MNGGARPNPWPAGAPQRAGDAFYPVRARDPAVRPLPYPFRGALAISNDAEYLQMDFFEALMRFLNTRGPTPFGPGLGLCVTSSAFFFSAQAYNLSYFDGMRADAPRSQQADRLDDYLRAGWIDTIHAYGDFDGAGGCTRAHAVEAFRALEKLGVRLEIFSNHGGVENEQNIGADAAYHRGDHAGHPAYHADLLAENGVRYVWTDSLVMPETRPVGWRGLLKRRRQPEPTELLATARLNDGREFVGFRRLRGTGIYAPNLASLHAQVQRVAWPDLYAAWGATVVYQHLGVLQRSAGVCEAATVEAVQRRPEVYLAPFRRLQREHDAGRLWVGGCAELLRYLEMVRSVTIRRDGAADQIAVEFSGTVAEPDMFFAGLTIAADPRRPVKVFYAGRELPTAWNGPDGEGGGYSISVTRPARPAIWGTQ